MNRESFYVSNGFKLVPEHGNMFVLPEYSMACDEAYLTDQGLWIYEVLIGDFTLADPFSMFVRKRNKCFIPMTMFYESPITEGFKQNVTKD